MGDQSAVSSAKTSVRERRAANPLIPPGLFASRCLARSIVVTGLGVVLIAGLAVAPRTLDEPRGSNRG